VVTAHPVDVLLRQGGTARAADLVALCGRSAVRTAVAGGLAVRVRRGRYALPATPDPRLSAARLGGVVSHASAARYWNLPALGASSAPHLTVARNRCRVDRRGAVVHFADLRPKEVQDGVTTPIRTVLDCARSMAPPDALAVADAALRQWLVSPSDLLAAAEGLRGGGRGRVLWVARHADPRAESPPESVLRAVVLLAGIRGFEPQVVIKDEDFFARADLGDAERRIAIEADSFEHHGHRSALVRDCRRYDELVVRGWMVLRFAWEQIMFEQPWVTATVAQAVDATRTGGRRSR
jgi:very-short-patch-repair endonuclease